MRDLFYKYFNKVFSSLLLSQDKVLMINGIFYEKAMLNSNIEKISDAEFSVYSQFGEDGIISFLVNNIYIKNKIFIEFGVENYTESNTRFLLKRYNWKGMVIDGSQKNVDYIKNDEIMWKHNLTPLCKFINKDNIDRIISSYTSEKDVGLLSIDIDGNDYWTWDAIKSINPRIVICEYNSLFGSDMSLTIPYQSNFSRNKAHYSNLYFGASISALVGLSKVKGYHYVGSGSAGVNAFFVRSDLVNEAINKVTNHDFVISKSRESRDKAGNLNYFDRVEQLECIKNMTLFNIDIKKEETISNLLPF
jgi:hypothetical protein